MKRFAPHIIIAFLLALAAAGCQDEFLAEGAIGKGKAKVTATLDFKPMSAALTQTRAAGNALKGIGSLHVLMYDYETKELMRSWELQKGEYEVSDEERTDGDAENGKTSETTTKRATFKLPDAIPFGKYRIYAVANIPDLLETHSEAIRTVDGLKAIPLTWNPEDISANGQMIGFLTKNSAQLEEEPLVVNEEAVKLHAWLRRAASKVTVSFDGSKLEEGVSIYIKSLTIRDIPTECYLGNANTISKEHGGLIENGESIVYGEGEIHESWPTITKDMPYFYYINNEQKEVVPKATYDADKQKYVDIAHGEYNEALYFYENMQGKGIDKRQEDKDGDGKPDAKPDKDGKTYGTYIEVEAYYNSDNPENFGSGDIKYRFMLGKNVIDDYDAERNHHYKLTLIFNRFANDPDWHIYKERYFGVTQPKDVDYRGKFFTPNDEKPNLGYDFSKPNTITVTSFEENIETKERNELEWKVSFREKGAANFTDKCDWIDCDISERNEDYEQEVTFNVHSDYVHVNIDSLLSKAPSKGMSSPYNLADQGGKTNEFGIECTANCYMVSAPGWYMFPLVYGNALHDGEKNENSYKYDTSEDAKEGDKENDNILSVFKNHLDSCITSPYINENKGCIAKSASLVWQDEKDLVTNIAYDASLYGGKGGVKFYVSSDKIRQGNAVIAVKDDNLVMWSWHIWVTRFDFEETITVTAHDTSRKFELMPVNLGWCSEYNARIKYYKSRECDIKFTAGGMEKVVTIKQYPHMAFPRGNNPYYQWGRKDPFIGTNKNWENKPRWDGNGEYQWANPPRITPDQNESGGSTNDYDGQRLTTREALALLIQKPDTWHNPPRKKGTDGNPYNSDNKTYINLWEGRPGTAPNAPTRKTVYDPCPVGYQVNHYNAFTGFTVTGDNADNGATDYWFHVRKEDIPDGNPKDSLFEFYTDRGKLQSIIFPETGYRDWDSYAGVYQFGVIGYIWAAGNYKNDDNNSYNFEFSRTNAYIDPEKPEEPAKIGCVRPKNRFYPCDGMPIRPCIYEKHGTQ